jgi:hypothetical protein
MKELNLSLRLAMALVAMTGCVLLVGCDEDKRVVEIAVESAKRQAAQDVEMARLNREIAEGSKRLVQANNQLLTSQHNLDDQRGQLETERRSLADERHRESVLGPIISTGGWLVVGSLPLILCWYLLHGLHRGGEDAEVGHLLIEEIVSDQPTLLPRLPDDTTLDQSSSRKALDPASDEPKET